MDDLQALVNHLLQSQFTDIKGSWANLHLQLPEKLLNEIMAMVLASQKSQYPWLALVQTVHVKGSVSLEIKLNA